MRCLFGFMCVLALGVVGCGDSDDDFSLREYCEDVYCSTSACEGRYLCEMGTVYGEPITFCEYYGTYPQDPVTGQYILCEAEFVTYLRCDAANGTCGEDPFLSGGTDPACSEQYFAFESCARGTLR
jgi:hypothetical protein